MDHLSPERILDQVRTRAAGLVKALSRLQASLDPANPAAIHPLPPWKDIDDLQRAATSHLTALYEILGDPDKSDFLDQAHVYPTPQFPHQAEYILEQLLRKRLQPSVQDWLDQGVKLGQELEASATRTENGHTQAQDKELEELWEWAGPASSTIAADIFPELATEEEPAQSKAKEVEVAQPMMAVQDILKFTTSANG